MDKDIKTKLEAQKPKFNTSGVQKIFQTIVKRDHITSLAVTLGEDVLQEEEEEVLEIESMLNERDVMKDGLHSTEF